VSESRVLRRIFGPKREEVARDWRRPRNKELTKYCHADQVKEDEMVGHIERMGEMRNVYKLW
jgi:hypothetical protein